MNRPFSPSLAGLALGAVSLAGVLGLSACGGAEEPAAPPSAAQSSAAAPSSEAPSSEAPSSDDPSSEAPSSGSGDSDEEKPDADDVKAGLAKFYQEKQGLTKKKAKAFANCMVDEMYDKATAKSLKAMQDGNPTQMDKADQSLLIEAATTCAEYAQ